MDTPSHICMGAATGIIISSVATAHGIQVDTPSVVGMAIIANTFPDIDVLYKLKSNYAYIQNHRGKSHALITSLLWVTLIFLTTHFILGQPTLISFIIALGIYQHLFTDLLNGYGVQLLWPFYNRWIALGITYTIDAILIALHVIGFILYFHFHFDAISTFKVIYIILGTYIFLSFMWHYHLKLQLVKKYGKYKRLILQARATPFTWKYVYETTDKEFYMGVVYGKNIKQIRYEKRMEILSEEIEHLLYSNKDYKAFVDFTPIYNYQIKHLPNDILEIKFYDLRYLMVRKNEQYYTFNCFVQIQNKAIITSYLAFTITEESAIKSFEKIKEKYGVS